MEQARSEQVREATLESWWMKLEVRQLEVGVSDGPAKGAGCLEIEAHRVEVRVSDGSAKVPSCWELKAHRQEQRASGHCRSLSSATAHR